MLAIAKHPIRKHYKGMPCMFGKVVGRIIGESDIGSWGVINGEQVFSVPLFSTPHGTILKIGRLYLDEITEDGMKKLLVYEEQLKTQGEIPYSQKEKSTADENI